MQATRSLVVVMLTMLLWSGATAPAQAQEPETWWRVQVVQVRPERFEDFTELYRDEINPALRRAGVPWRSAWRTGEFGEFYERMFVTPMNGFAELDGGGPLARGLGAREYERVIEKLRESSVGRQTYAVRYRRDLSVESDDVSGLSLARVTNLLVATGRSADFEAVLRDNLTTFRDAGVVFGVYQREFGPGPVVWQIVENLRSYADLERGGILRAFGDNAESFTGRLIGVVSNIERTVLEYDPELSYTEVVGTTSQP